MSKHLTYRWKNADGSETLLETGGTEMYHGGRIHHVGSSALPTGETISLDPSVTENFQHGRRQRDSVRDMVNTF